MGSIFFVIRAFLDTSWPATGCIVYVSCQYAKAKTYASTYEWNVPGGCVYVCEINENQPLTIDEWKNFNTIKDRYDYK
jgi:hypothetical protein